MSYFTDFFTYAFLTRALISSLLLGLVCGLISPIIVAKKFAFMGSAISHGALLGVACALALFGQNDVALFCSTLFITAICVLPLAWSTFRQRIPSDALIGLFLTATMSIGLIIHHLFGKNSTDLLSHLFGNILTLSLIDLYILGVLALLLTPLVYKYRLHIIHFIFDEQSTSIQGINTKLYHFILFFTITLVVVSGLKISGVILINAYLLLPGTFALLIAPSALKTFNYSIIFALCSTLLGLFLANMTDLPTGATIATTQVFFYFAALSVKKIST